MKKKLLVLLPIIWLLLSATTKGQDQLDSLLTENSTDLENVNPYDLCFCFKDLLKKACDQVQTSDHFQVIEQGKNLCSISYPRLGLQIFIDNYLFRRKNFSISLFCDKKKFAYITDEKGNGGYFKSDPQGYLVFNSIFMGSDRFLPLTKNEIIYFHERILQALRLTKQALQTIN
jgi:hypothetical protein